MRILIALIVFQFSLVMGCSEEQSESSKRSSKGTGINEQTLEYKLAAIDLGDSMAGDNPAVTQYGILLDMIDSSFLEDRKTIADMTVKLKKMLLKDGIKEDLIQILNGFSQVLPKTSEKQEYALYAVTYETLRTNGKNHPQAIRALQAMVQETIVDASEL